MSLNKILPCLFYPLFSLGLVMGLGLLLKRNTLIGFSLALLGISSSPWFGKLVLGAWERSVPILTAEDCPQADVIMVCSGIADNHPRESSELEWTEAVDRFTGALRLYRMKKAPEILFFLDSDPRKNPQGAEAPKLKVEAIRQGVPAENIHILGPIANTAGEAKVASAWMSQRQIRSAILVTTAWHMPRALYLFSRGKANIQPFPVDFSVPHPERFSPVDWIPQSSGLRMTEITMREWMGTGWYFLDSLLSRNRKTVSGQAGP